jgi:hypothetical protein
MIKKTENSASKVKYRKEGADVIFTIEGNHREYTICLASPEQAAFVVPDLNEFIWAVERAWRKSK